MSEDDRALMERLAALEAEVKADESAKRARKEAAMDKVREQRAAQQADRDRLRERQAELVSRKPQSPASQRRDNRDDLEDLDDGGIGGALELAKKAHGVKQELVRKPKAGEKSVVKSAVASMLLGPLGWLYAGSFREAIPASAAWLVFAAIASKIIPTVLLMPILMVALPLSGIAGLVYALQHNRHGGRQRLFDKDKDDKPKQLRSG